MSLSIYELRRLDTIESKLDILTALVHELIQELKVPEENLLTEENLVSTLISAMKNNKSNINAYISNNR